jgi:hypothetical protein
MLGSIVCMRTYRPRIVKRDTGLEQCFEANILAIEDIAGIDGGRLIAFGDLVPRRGRPLNQGTPVHSLMLQISEDDITVELNDQGNQRGENEVERFELSPSHFRVQFTAGDGPYSGRVSLSPEIELFEDSDDEPVLLRSVRVGLSGVSAQTKALRTELRKNSFTAKKLVEIEPE